MPETMWRFKNFFSGVGKSLSTKIKPSPTTYRPFIKHINSKNSLFLTPTDAYEIQLLIKNLKMKSNSSPNDIPSKFLKIASCIVSEWLSKLFNKCMTTAEFPDSWKIAASLQFLKFIAQVPHLNIDQSLFFRYYQSCLKKFFITEYTLIWQNTI